MTKFLQRTAGLALLTVVMAAKSYALPRQAVVIVAEGLNAQTIDMGTGYVTAASQEEGATPAFSTLRAQGKTATADANVLTSLKGLLQTAQANGYRTGFVTTEDVTTVAPLFYNVAGQGAAVAQALSGDLKFNYIAGGGRAAFNDDVRKAITAAGGTAITDVESFEAIDTELKGKVVTLQSDAGLTYSIDRVAENEVGLGDLASTAITTLAGENNDAPYLLVIHDTLIKKAIDAKDTPAVLEQFREVDGILSEIMTMREDNQNLGVAVIATGGTSAPKFDTNTPGDRSNAYFIVSQLPLSYAGAGAALTGANEEKLTEFAAEEYKGWSLSPENRAAIIAGTMTPEVAIRASYEPALKISYDTVPAQATIHALGFEGDALAALTQMASTAPSK